MAAPTYPGGHLACGAVRAAFAAVQILERRRRRWSGPPDKRSAGSERDTVRFCGPVAQRSEQGTFKHLGLNAAAPCVEGRAYGAPSAAVGVHGVHHDGLHPVDECAIIDRATEGAVDADPQDGASEDLSDDDSRERCAVSILCSTE